MATTSLEQISKMAAGFDKETLTQEDFLAAFKKVTELIKKIKQGQVDNQTALDGQVNAFTQGQIDKLEQAIADLKKQVNQAFVGDVMTRLEGEQNTKLGSALQTMQDKIDSMRDGKDSNFEDVAKALLGNPKFLQITRGKDGSTDRGLEIASKLNLFEDGLDMKTVKGLAGLFEEIDKKFKRVAESRIPSGPNANAVRVHVVSDQCTGENRRFTMPMARNVLKFEMSQFPFNLYRDSSTEDHGFTVGDRSITLNSAAPAPDRGQSAVIWYIK